MSIEAMKQALEALEVANSCIDGYYLPKEKAWLPEIEQAVTSLRQAIAEAEKHEVSQEPVAWRHDMGEENGGWEYFEKASCPDCQPLYTHPQPKREPLTDKQIAEFFGVKAVDESFVDFVRAIEAAHGITSDMKQEHGDKTAKQRHEWVGLTDEEAIDIGTQCQWYDGDCERFDSIGFSRAIEAKLKQKNGYAEEKNT